MPMNEVSRDRVTGSRSVSGAEVSVILFNAYQ